MPEKSKESGMEFCMLPLSEQLYLIHCEDVALTVTQTLLPPALCILKSFSCAVCCLGFWLLVVAVFAIFCHT